MSEIGRVDIITEVSTLASQMAMPREGHTDAVFHVFAYLDIYLGARLRKVQLDNGVFAWGMSPEKYVQEAVRNVEEHLTKEYGGRNLPKKETAPWPSKYPSPRNMEVGSSRSEQLPRGHQSIRWISSS